MSLEQASYLAQIIASVGVILSLIFVGLQVRQSTAAMERGEHNATMSQWTTIRMAIIQSRDVGELMTRGLKVEAELDAADQLRLDMLLNEFAWASFHIWDRTRRGLFPPGTFEAACGATLGELIKTERGQLWWRKAPGTGLAPQFIADVDAYMRKG